MTEKITDEELADLLEALKRAHGMGVCSKAVKLAQLGLGSGRQHPRG